MSLLENINVNEILVWSDIFPYVQSLTILVQRIKKKKVIPKHGMMKHVESTKLECTFISNMLCDNF